MNITCFNTWKEFFQFKLVATPEAEDNAIRADFMALDSSFEKWLCIASEQQQLVLAKVADNQSPVILHSFLNVQGNRKEFGLQKYENSGTERLVEESTGSVSLGSQPF